MKFADDVFKAYDIRGLSGSELTTDLARAVGLAVAQFLPQTGPVIVGRDMRRDSAELAAALIQGLVAGGRDVWDIGLVTTDMVYFAAGHFAEAAGGAMVTASHNPGNYNGIKLCGHDAVPMGATNGLMQIKDIVAGDGAASAPHAGEVIEKSIVGDWVDKALSFVDLGSLKPYKVAVDAGNGMAGAIFPAVQAKLPFEVTPMFFDLDGSFPNHPANPHVHTNLRAIIDVIKKNNLDFGLAFDGDGDRGVLIDETGTPVPEGITGAILTDHFLHVHPGAPICYDVRTSRIVEDTIKEHGGRPVRTKVGGDSIKATMRTEDAVLGIEASGHYYFKDNYYSDSGLIAVLTIVSILSKCDMKLSELAAHFAKYATADEQNFEVANSEAVIGQLAEAFKDGQQDRLDGLTVSYPDWWFNVRPSNTEPLIRLNIEAHTQTLLEQKTAQIHEHLR